MKAEPSWRRQAIFPILNTAKLAHVPRKMPNAVHNCHDLGVRLLFLEIRDLHDQTSSHRRRYILSVEDRNSRSLKTHTDTHEDAADEELIPVLSEAASDRSYETENSGDENCTTTTEVVVDRVVQPAAEHGCSKVRSRVDQADEVLVLNVVDVRVRNGSLGGLFRDAKLNREGQVGTVRTGLVPALDGSTDGG